MMIRTLLWCSLLAGLGWVSGCVSAEAQADDHDHAHDDHAHDDHAHDDHAHDDRAHDDHAHDDHAHDDHAHSGHDGHRHDDHAHDGHGHDDHAHDGHGHGHGIEFSLERQQQTEFTVVEVANVALRPNVPAFAHLVLPAGARAVATAPREGRLTGVDGALPHVGQRVEVGDTLFSLSLVAADAADLAGLDLAVDRASIEVSAAQREVDRLRPLVAQGVVAQRRLDDAESTLAAAEAASRSARRRRSSVGESQSLEGRGDSMAVPSPVAGVVTEVYSSAGSWVREGDPVIRIVNPELLWVDVDVPEAYIGRLEQVSGAWLELTGFDEPFDVPAEALVSVGVEIEPATRTLPIRFEVPNEDGRLYAGMSALAHLVTGLSEPVPAIPATAVVDDSGTDVVYVQTGDEEFERRPVRLGIRDGLLVHAEGVVAGERVVDAGAYSIKLAASSTESVGHGHAH